MKISFFYMTLFTFLASAFASPIAHAGDSIAIGTKVDTSKLKSGYKLLVDQDEEYQKTTTKVSFNDMPVVYEIPARESDKQRSNPCTKLRFLGGKMCRDVRVIGCACTTAIGLPIVYYFGIKPYLS